MRDINSLNKVILLGRLGQKPEIRVLPQKDRSVARFSLATNERYYNPANSQATDKTEWHRIVAWGKQAEFCEKFLEQGKQVLIEGKLRTRSWQDRDGNKRTTTEIEAFNIILLGRREGGQEGDRPYAGGGGSGFHADAPAADFPSEDESTPEGGSGGGGGDDIPF